MKYLITGLGNIGPEYELTRHNVGFLVLDQLAGKYSVNFELKRHANVALIKYKGRSLYLVKPTTYMNLSGKAVNFWLNELKIDTDHSLVVTDDVALPFGKLRLRPKGSDAGHNGLKNIESVIGHNSYPRLRFGIGDDFHKAQKVDYVLSRFTDEEFKQLPECIDRACTMILSYTSIGIERTMNQYN